MNNTYCFCCSALACFTDELPVCEKCGHIFCVSCIDHVAEDSTLTRFVCKSCAWANSNFSFLPNHCKNRRFYELLQKHHSLKFKFEQEEKDSAKYRSHYKQCKFCQKHFPESESDSDEND